MDSVLTRLPISSTRAQSAGPSSPHRNLMEDADPSGTRKRPRLDSGDRAHRSMSADPLGATPSSAGRASTSVTSTSGQNESQSSQMDDGLPAPLPITPSKVTINVRGPTLDTSPTCQIPPLKPNPTIRGGFVGDASSASHQGSSTDVSSPPAKTNSVTSSPLRSPEIEVAEVEDMNDDPGETRWKPLSSDTTTTNAHEAKAIHTLLLSQFPHCSGHTLKNTVTKITGALQKSEWSYYLGEALTDLNYRQSSRRPCSSRVGGLDRVLSTNHRASCFTMVGTTAREQRLLG